jgi:hypothetical protein
MPFNECPVTEIKKPGSYNDIWEMTRDSTSSFNFSGGWKSTTDSQPTNYNYTSTPNGYELDVVPNWSNLTWLSGTGKGWGFCGLHSPEECYTYTEYDAKPLKNWAGYISNSRSGEDYMIVQQPVGCTQCGSLPSGNRVLCTSNTEMDINSCPGHDKFSNPPSIIPLGSTRGNYGGYSMDSGYYANLNANSYPRGRGKCLYKFDTIKTDKDLTELLALKNNSLIHPDLADELAARYCYSSIPGVTCGKDFDGNIINNCIRYRYDELTSTTDNIKPCVTWRKSKINEGISGRNFLDSYAEAWCNNINNKYTPLCDCFKKNDNNGAIPVRNYYELVTNQYKTLTDVIPARCWYKPCKSNEYSIEKLEPQEVCNAKVNVCNQINNIKDTGSIDVKQQYLSCSIDGESSTVTDPDKTNNNESFLIKYKVYIIVAIVSFVVIISISLIVSKKTPIIITSS